MNIKLLTPLRGKRTVILCAMILALSSLTIMVHQAHASTTSPGYRSYLGNSYLTASLSKTSNDLSPPPFSGWYTLAEGNGASNGVGYADANVGLLYFYGQDVADAKVTFQDQWFTVPNNGQVTTLMDFSGDYSVLGFLYAEAVLGFCCALHSTAQFNVQTFVAQEPIGGGTSSTVQTWAEHSLDWSVDCNPPLPLPQPPGWPPDLVAPTALCNKSLAIGSPSQNFSFGHALYLTPGYQYALGMIFEAQAQINGNGFVTGQSNSCLNYPGMVLPGSLPLEHTCSHLPLANNNPIWNFQLPQTPSTNCPSGTTNNPCFYFEWTDSTVNLTDENPTISLSTIPTTVLDGVYNPNSEAIQITLSTNFAGSVYLYYHILPPVGASSKPTTSLVNNFGQCCPGSGNGTLINTVAGGTYYPYLYVIPCSSLNSCDFYQGSTYPPASFIIPGRYTVVLTAVSGSVSSQTVTYVDVQYFDFGIQNVSTSYKNGYLFVNATLANNGNGSLTQDKDVNQRNGNSAGNPTGWHEVVTTYIDGNFANFNPVYTCGTGAGSGQWAVVCPDNGSASWYGSYLPESSATGHNVTVVATEEACIPINPFSCNWQTGDWSDINVNNNRFYSDFVLSDDQGSIEGAQTVFTVRPGASVTDLVHFQANPGFQDTVSIADSVPSGWGVSFNATSIMLSSTQNKNAIATISVPNSAPPGNYTVTLFGIGTFISHPLNITVQVGDFNIAPSTPASVTMNAGSYGYQTISLTSLNGFAGTVNLSVSPSTPAGLHCSLPASATFGTSPQTASLACYSNSVGNYTVTVTGTIGTLSHITASITFRVQDFAISAAPPSSTIYSSGTVSTISITALNGFTGSVTLTWSASPLYCYFYYNSYYFAAITVSVPSSVGLYCSGPAGNYVVTVTGTSASLLHSVPVSVTVRDFSLTVSPASINIPDGRTGSVTIQATSLNGYAGTISLASSAISCSSSSLSKTTLSLASGGSDSATLSITPNTTCPGQTQSLSVSGTDSTNSLYHSTPFTLFTSDFQLGVGQSPVGINQGSSGTVNIQATNLNNYPQSSAGSTSEIQLSVSGLPSGVTASFAPAANLEIDAVSVNDTYQRAFGLTMDQSLPTAFWNSLPGSNIGTSTWPCPCKFTYIQSFTMTVGPHYLQVGVSAWTGYWNIKVYLNGVLMANSTVNINTHVAVNFNVPPCSPPFLCVPYSSQMTVSVSNTAVSGQYTLAVTGTDGVLSRTTYLDLRVGSFALSASPSNPSTVIGSGTSTTITASPFYGVSDALILSAAGFPSCVTYSFSPTTIGLPSGGSVTLSMNMGTACTAGSYPVTLYATGQKTSQSTGITLTISTSCGCGGGGGGSVAAGTLITMADGSKVPVQNLRVGDRMLGYDPATGTSTVSVVNRITVVTTDNMLIIHTATGAPFRTDANPHQTLWVKTAAGQIGWLPVTQIKPGDFLFTVHGWVIVTQIDYIPNGTYAMYDIFATVPYFASGYLDPIRKM